MTEAIISLDNVSRIYSMGSLEVPALADVSLEVLPDEFVTLVMTWRGIRTPPFAAVPYAPSKSIGWTSRVPIPIDLTGTAVDG